MANRVVPGWVFAVVVLIATAAQLYAVYSMRHDDLAVCIGMSNACADNLNACLDERDRRRVGP